MAKQVVIEPASGGQLRTAISSERPGINNYVIKRDWRRELDREVRREGHDYFWPLEHLRIGVQPFPQNQPDYPAIPKDLNLIHLVRAANGETSVVVGTETTLYSFYPNRYNLTGAYFEPGEVPNDQVIIGPFINVDPFYPYGEEWYPWDDRDYDTNQYGHSAGHEGGGGTAGGGGPPPQPPPGTPNPTDPDSPTGNGGAGGGGTGGGIPSVPSGYEMEEGVYVADPVPVFGDYLMGTAKFLDWMENMCRQEASRKMADMTGAGWSDVKILYVAWSSQPCGDPVHSAEYVWLKETGQEGGNPDNTYPGMSPAYVPVAYIIGKPPV